MIKPDIFCIYIIIAGTCGIHLQQLKYTNVLYSLTSVKFWVLMSVIIKNIPSSVMLYNVVWTKLHGVIFQKTRSSSTFV